MTPPLTFMWSAYFHCFLKLYTEVVCKLSSFRSATPEFGAPTETLQIMPSSLGLPLPPFPSLPPERRMGGTKG